MQYLIQKLQPSDNQFLSELAKRIYFQTYTYLWNDLGDWYVETMYSPQKLYSELMEDNSEFYCFMEDGSAIGYLKINLQVNHDTHGFEIERIYFEKSSSVKGYGGILLNFGIRRAKQLGKKKVYLKVMNSSKKAINFYEKHGFRYFSKYDLDFETMKDEFRQINTMKLDLSDEG